MCGDPPDPARRELPPLAEGVTYTRVAAGYGGAVLLRSDGSAAALGFEGDVRVPLPGWLQPL